MVIIGELRVDGTTAGAVVAQPKEFKTKSRGYFGAGKCTIDGKRYQCTLMLVEIGSKPDKAEDAGEGPDAGESG